MLKIKNPFPKTEHSNFHYGKVDCLEHGAFIKGAKAYHEKVVEWL